jgi:hypothetical protein
MRTLCFFLFPLCAYSQFPAVFEPVMREYLSLTEAQLQDIRRNNDSYRQALNESIRRLSELNRQVVIETLKPGPDPETLGLGYQQIEMLCRQRETPASDAYQQNLRVLTEAQRELLRRLDNASSLDRVASAADAAFLTEGSALTIPGRIPAQRVIPALVTPVATDIGSDLVAYLDLTLTQLEQLRSNLRSYWEFLAGRRARMNEVNQELQSEFAEQLPQAFALGERYSEIEAHRRQIAAREASLRRTNRALLTTEQIRRLQGLRSAGLFPTLSLSAEQMNLLPPRRDRPASRPTSTLGIDLSLLGISSLDDSTAATSMNRSCRIEPFSQIISVVPLTPAGSDE